TLLPQFGRDEAVNGEFGPALWIRWGFDWFDWLECPAAFPLKGRTGRLPRPRCTLLPPGYEIGHDGNGQPLVWRHLDARVGLPNCLNEQALLRIARHERRPAVATLKQGSTRIDAQTVAELLASMARKAGAGEDWADLQFKEAFVGSLRLAAGLS